MRVFLATALLVFALETSAADKQLPVGRSSDDKVEIQADLILGPEQVREAVGPSIAGADLGGNFVGVRVTIRPLSDAPVKVWRDDFMMLSDKDGQRSQPFGPTQIAGAGAMIIKMKQGQTVGTDTDHRPVWSGGIGGLGMGTPGTAPETTAQVQMKDEKKKTDTPLLEVLREKILPEETTLSEPRTALLFFEIDGKVKAKNLALFYKTQDGNRLGMRFTVK